MVRRLPSLEAFERRHSRPFLLLVLEPDVNFGVARLGVPLWAFVSPPSFPKPKQNLLRHF